MTFKIEGLASPITSLGETVSLETYPTSTISVGTILLGQNIDWSTKQPGQPEALSLADDGNSVALVM